MCTMCALKRTVHELCNTAEESYLRKEGIEWFIVVSDLYWQTIAG